MTREGVAHGRDSGRRTQRRVDEIEVHGGRVTFRREQPGGVTWAVEDGSQVDVRATRGTLILALQKGAVEAQVAPVPGGEGASPWATWREPRGESMGRTFGS